MKSWRETEKVELCNDCGEPILKCKCEDQDVDELDPDTLTL